MTDTAPSTAIKYTSAPDLDELATPVLDKTGTNEVVLIS